MYRESFRAGIVTCRVFHERNDPKNYMDVREKSISIARNLTISKPLYKMRIRSQTEVNSPWQTS